jgi:uncharacterized protein DUF6152
MRRRWFTISVGAVAALVAALPAAGHHSFAAAYFEDQTMSIDGSLEEFEYRNPHSWVRVSAADGSGRMQTYGAEWASTNRLAQQGIAKDTLKPGDRVIVTGSPARDPGSYTLHLKRIERPADGWQWIGRAQAR